MQQEDIRSRLFLVTGSSLLEGEISPTNWCIEKVTFSLMTCFKMMWFLLNISWTLAYVTLDDIRGLKAFEEQTVVVVKAPDETVLKVPEPSEVQLTDIFFSADIWRCMCRFQTQVCVNVFLQDFIQIHVRSWNGPVTVLTCDIEAEDTAERNIGFSSLEESRMKTSPLQGGNINTKAHWQWSTPECLN